MRTPPRLAGPISPPRAIVHVFTPAAVGGLERVVQALASGQHARGARVAAVAVRPGVEGPNATLDALRAGSVPVHEVRVPARGYRAERRAVGALLAELAPDVVHTHGFRADVVDAGVARRLGMPTVTTVHGRTGGSGRVRAYEMLQFLTFRRFQAVVAVSRSLRETLVRYGIAPARAHFVPNGWSGGRIATPRAAARAALGVPADALRLAWVGRLSHEKGADVLLEALARCDARWTASIVGDGPERAGLAARVAALGLGARVTLHGAIADAAQLLPAFDAFVLSSRTEGTPISLFEAMAAAVPVVATRVGGVPDVVGDHGALLVASEQPAELARALDRLLADPASARTRVARALARLERDYAATPWLDRYDCIYDELCARA